MRSSYIMCAIPRAHPLVTPHPLLVVGRKQSRSLPPPFEPPGGDDDALVQNVIDQFFRLGKCLFRPLVLPTEMRMEVVERNSNLLIGSAYFKRRASAGIHHLQEQRARVLRILLNMSLPRRPGRDQ